MKLFGESGLDPMTGLKGGLQIDDSDRLTMGLRDLPLPSSRLCSERKLGRLVSFNRRLIANISLSAKLMPDSDRSGWACLIMGIDISLSSKLVLDSDRTGWACLIMCLGISLSAKLMLDSDRSGRACLILGADRSLSSKLPLDSDSSRCAWRRRSKGIEATDVPLSDRV